MNYREVKADHDCCICYITFLLLWIIAWLYQDMAAGLWVDFRGLFFEKLGSSEAFQQSLCFQHLSEQNRTETWGKQTWE